MNVLSFRSIGPFFFLLMLSQKANAQDKIFVANGSDIGYVDLTDFTYKFVVATPGFVDIAITPQGKIYGIAGTPLYEVNTLTGVSTLIPLTLNDPYYNGGNSMVSDRNGDLFVTGSNSNLYKIDMKTATLSLVGGTILMASGDLGFSDGKLYMIANGNMLVEIILGPGGNSILSQRVVGPIGVEGTIYSITINENGICYVVSTSQELALVDLDDATTYVISKPVKGAITSVWGAAMQQEGLNDKDIEICGNGLDDDHNGYIDDNDMACRLKRGACNTDGQEIFREDFGTGTGYGSPLQGLGSGAYLFSDASPLKDGCYTIVDNARTAQGNSTWKDMGDHSGQPGGRMLLVNGSYKPGEFYRREVSGLCAGLQYALSVSASSVIAPGMNCGADVSPIPSRIRFRIEDKEGNLLGQLAERYIPADPDPAAKWKGYGIMFTLPEGVTTIQIVMLDDAPGGCGNDMAVDDIVLSTCKPLQSISINGSSNSYNGCQHTSAILKVDTVGLKLNHPLLQWQKFNNSTGLWVAIAGAQSDTYVISGLGLSDKGEYRVIINENVIASCRKEAISMVASLSVSDKIIIDVSPALTVCKGSPLQLQGKSNEVLAEVLWLGPDNYPYRELAPEITKTATNENAGVYQLRAIGTDGCQGQYNTEVTIAEISPPDFTFGAAATCVGQPVNALASGKNLTGWKWEASGSHEISGENTAIPSITWNTSGVHELTLSATGQCVVDQPVTHSISVNGPPDPGHLQIPEFICLGEPLVLALTDATGAPSWQITGDPEIEGTSDKTIVNWAKAGSYTIGYSVTGQCGSVDLSTPLQITVRDRPAVALLDDTTICRGSQLILRPVYSSNIVAFSWQNGPFVTESRYSASKAGQYRVVVEDNWGCKNYDEVVIQEKDCGCNVFVPTAFSPNGDGINDTFRPVVYCVVASYQLQIYNRWGQLIFMSQSPGVGWDGVLKDRTKADIGTYTWMIEYKSHESKDGLRKMGTVTLLR